MNDWIRGPARKAGPAGTCSHSEVEPSITGGDENKQASKQPLEAIP